MLVKKSEVSASLASVEASASVVAAAVVAPFALVVKSEVDASLALVLEASSSVETIDVTAFVLVDTSEVDAYFTSVEASAFVEVGPVLAPVDIPVLVAESDLLEAISSVGEACFVALDLLEIGFGEMSMLKGETDCCKVGLSVRKYKSYIISIFSVSVESKISDLKIL